MRGTLTDVGDEGLPSETLTCVHCAWICPRGRGEVDFCTRRRAGLDETAASAAIASERDAATSTIAGACRSLRVPGIRPFADCNQLGQVCDINGNGTV